MIVASIGFVKIFRKDSLRKVIDEIDRPLIVTVLFSASFLICLTTIGIISHWDHLLVPTPYIIDFARTGDSYSDWIRSNIGGHWVLIQQTTSISLDAFEILWNGSLTSTYSKYLVLVIWLCISAIMFNRERFIASLFCLGLLSYVAESMVQFRPHIYIGMLIVLFGVIRHYHFSSKWLLHLICFFIALAKRDGLIIAPFLLLLTVDKKFLLKASMIALPFFILGITLSKIDRQSVGQIFLRTFGQWPTWIGTFKELSNHSFFIPVLICISLSIFFRFRYRKKQPAIIPMVIVTVLVVFSGFLLSANERYNFGTIDRKIHYFLLPIIGLYLYHLSNHVLDVRYQLNSENFKRNFLRGLIYFFFAIFFLKPLYDSSTSLVKTYDNAINWTRAAVRDIESYSSIFRNDKELSYGIYMMESASFQWSFLHDLQLSKFPMLIALVGNKITFSNKLAKLYDSDVVYLPHEMSDAQLISIQIPKQFTVRFLHGGLKVLINSKAEANLNDNLVMQFPDKKPVEETFKEIYLNESKVVWKVPEGGKVSHTKWDDKNFLISLTIPSQTPLFDPYATFAFNNEHEKYIYAFKFSNFQLDRRPPDKIRVLSESIDKTFNAENLKVGDDYQIPLSTNDKNIKVFLYPKNRGLSSTATMYITSLKMLTRDRKTNI